MKHKTKQICCGLIPILCGLIFTFVPLSSFGVNLALFILYSLISFYLYQPGDSMLISSFFLQLPAIVLSLLYLICSIILGESIPSLLANILWLPAWAMFSFSYSICKWLIPSYFNFVSLSICSTLLLLFASLLGAYIAHFKKD